MAKLRREYEAQGLVEEDLAEDPFTQFESWFQGVIESGLEEPNAFVLATADARGRPSARALLMKAFSAAGVDFVTNLESRKSRNLSENPWGAATFLWVPLHRQVRFEGPVQQLDDLTADAYFRRRPRGAQIAAHASDQSRPVASRAAMDRLFAEISELYPDEVPRPQSWGGWRLAPELVEFWQGQPNRFHDRIVYRRTDDAWERERLAP